MSKSILRGFGALLIGAVAILPLLVCSGSKPTEQKTPAQPAGGVTAETQPGAANVGNLPSVGPPAAGVAGDAALGKALFVKNCILCHNADSTVKKIGPGLKGILKNKELPMSHKPATEANVRSQIEHGNVAKGMPAFGTQLSKAEIDSLIAYLKTL